MAVKVEGLRELERALQELPKTTARNTLRRVLRKAAEPVQSTMEAIAPRDTGWTAESIEISSTLNAAQRREAKREGTYFAEVHIGMRRGSAAIFQEFGTIDQPARPFMRPAWDATQDIALRTIETQLGGEIEKSAQRLARKAARLAAKG